MTNDRTYIIAEAGSNHDNKISQARELIEVAAQAGADAVKFQLFKADALYPKDHPAHKVVRENELPREWVGELMSIAKQNGIDFLATPFDSEAIDILEKHNVKAYKWASSETTNHKLLLEIARTQKPVFVSTGMCTLADVAEAMDILDTNGCPSVTLMHCYSVYPTEFHDANLRVMNKLAEMFNKPPGFSDHSLDISLPIAAAALGAKVIEKHFTLSRSLQGPDHSYALEPKELTEMVKHIRNVEKALGTSEKKLHPLEVEWGRRDGIYLRAEIKKGQKITAADIELKRPAKGIAGRYQSAVVGLKLRETLPAGAPVNWRDLE